MKISEFKIQQIALKLIKDNWTSSVPLMTTDRLETDD